MPTRKEQASAMRAKIISVVESKIRTEGYEHIKIADVAKECKMSAGNFYHYFDSLNDLFDEIDSIKFYNFFDELQRNNDLTILERLKTYFLTWLELSLDYYGSEYMYYWTRRYTQKSSENKNNNRVTLIANHIQQILIKGIEKGELIDTIPIQDIAYTIAFMIFGCSTYFGATNDEDTVRNWYKNSYEQFIEVPIKRYLKN